MMRLSGLSSMLSLCVACVACAAGEGGGAKATVTRGKCAVASEACEQAKASLAEAQGVIKQRCVSCHSADGSAGDEHDFTVEATVQSHRKKILAEVASCGMPPPGATPLKDQERAAIECWASAP